MLELEQKYNGTKGTRDTKEKKAQDIHDAVKFMAMSKELIKEAQKERFIILRNFPKNFIFNFLSFSREINDFLSDFRKNMKHFMAS